MAAGDAAAGARSALIVANYDYTDPGLGQLHAPASDARALEVVLRDPAIGGFEVRTLLDERLTRSASRWRSSSPTATPATCC